MAKQALSHLRIVDLTHYVAGPYCAKLAAGFGADVVKIERPQTGDPCRQLAPFYRHEPGVERSIPFLWLNTGKRSVTLNLKSDRGAELLKQLIRDADAVVENFRPGVMERLGLSYSALREVNPRLVVVSISNFGQTGPYRDYLADEAQLYAIGGAMYVSGDPKRAPLNSGPAVCQYTAGQRAYAAMLMALLARESTGTGTHVDVSIMEGTLDHVENRLAACLETGKNSNRGTHLFAPWDLYKCRDGFASIAGAPFRRWTRGAEMFEEPQLLEPRLRHVRDRVQHRHEVDALMQPWLNRHTRKEVRKAGVERGLAVGYVATFDEVLESPQHQARGFFETVDHPVAGKHRYCGTPFSLSETPLVTHRAPLLGEHNEEIFGTQMGLAKVEIDALRKEGVIG